MANPRPPNLDLERGGNAIEGIYATNHQLQRLFDIFSNDLAAALGPNGAAQQAAQQRLITACTDAHTTTTAVAQLADRGRQRVSETTNPLMTTLPDFTIALVAPAVYLDDLPDKRNIRLPKPFTGGSSPSEAPVECRAHLAAIMDIARTNRLSEEGTKKLVKLNVGNDLALMVGEMMEAGASLEAIIRKIEVMYGGLKTPEQAQMECNRASRYPSETLMALGRRIKHLAYMATRMKPDKREAAEALGKETFLATISFDLRQKLKSLDDKKLALGQIAMDYETLISEAKRLDDENKTEMLVAKTRGSVSSTIRVVQNQEEYFEEEPQGEEGIEEVEYGPDGNILRIFRRPGFSGTRPYQSRGGRFQRRSFPYANRRGGGQLPPFNYPPKGIRQVSDQTEGEYGYEEDELQDLERADVDVVGSCLYIPAGRGNGKDYIKVDPRELNVTPDQCLKCGLTGHRAFGRQSEKCPLKNQPIVTKPCSLCNKGAHVAAVCPRKSKN